MKSMFITPDDAMTMWKALYTLGTMKRYENHKNDSIALQDMYNETSDTVQLMNAHMQKFIKQEYGKYLPYFVVPDLCQIQVDVDAEEINPDNFTPGLFTKNPYTFAALSEILLDSPDPKTAMFMMSENCNLQCKYCFEKHTNQQVMSIDNAIRFVDALFTDDNVKSYIQADSHKSIILEFMGGEPLLQVDLIKKVCDHFIDNCLKYNRLDWLLFHTFNLTTNGTLYFEDNVQDLLTKFPELNLTFSVDGTKECHDSNRVYKDGRGSYDDVVKAIRAELNRGRLNVPRMTFSSKTIPYLSESVKAFYNMHVPAVSIAPVLEEEYSKEDALEYYRQLCSIASFMSATGTSYFVDLFSNCTVAQRDSSESFCGGEGGMLTMQPNGTYTTCHRMHDNDGLEHSIVLGNAKDGFLSTEEYRENYRYLSENRIFNKVWPEKCKGCPFIGKCVGCPAVNLEKNKSLTGGVNTNGCYLNLARYAANIYYQAKVFEKVREPYIEKYAAKFLEFLPEDEVQYLIAMEKYYYEN